MKKYNYNDKEKIIIKLELLNTCQHDEIFKIIKKNDINYTKNMNGVFIDFEKIPDKVINEIVNFLDFCKENNIFFQFH